VIVDGVSELRECLLEMFLQREARVIGTDGDSHEQRLYYTVSGGL
jgi:hypothetical protein